MKNTEKNIERKLFFSHVLSDDVFHIIFDNVYFKDSVQISRLFIMLLYHTPPNKRSLASSIWRFPILLLYFDHRFMKVLLIINFWREICTARVCLASRSVTSVIKKKGRDSRPVRKLNNYISSI